MQAFRLKSGGALAVCSGLQSGQFPSTFGSSRENQTLVASQSAYETDPNRSEGCQAQRIYHVSNGRGCDKQGNIC